MSINTIKQLKKLRTNLQICSNFSIGYPVNLDFDYSFLSDFLKFFLNNIGDSFEKAIYKINTKKFEKEVLHFFARLYKIQKKDFWGYITSGGTEGNMYGLFIARERYPTGIVYFSKDTHYSISKIVRVLKMKHNVVNSIKNGEIDYQDLEKKIIKNKKFPVIINVNIGTTVKGAIDNIDTIFSILKRNRITKYHIHCDAALFGVMLPYLRNAPKLTFKKQIGSIAISGHKFIGSPIPCGVVLTRKRFVEKIKKEIEYIGVSDTTLSGCRSGFTALILWHAIKTRGTKGFKKEAFSCLKNTKYLLHKLENMGYRTAVNPFSNIVMIFKPPKHVIKKWQLAIEGQWAHVVVMQHVTKSKIDTFLLDFKKL